MNAKPRTKTAAVKLIENTCSRLWRILGSEGTPNQRYYETQLTEERDHRKGCWGGDRGYALPVPTIAKMMYSRMILAYHCGEWKTPDPADYFHTRESAMMAYALYARNREKIAAAFTTEEAKAFCDGMDYSKLIAGDWA